MDDAAVAAGGIAVIPKGLRTYTAEDRDFFLALLPGPRDREGLPESVRFWKSRIEAREASRPFRVGLLYGPSGSGKSSLFRAGVMPRLASWVRVVYVEASADGTELALRRALADALPEIDPALSLADTIAAWRRRGEAGTRVLLVIDQAEQWLHARCGEIESSELFAALRQADGEHVAAVLLIRDDFWLAAARLFHALEAPMVEGENVGLVDLFSRDHARRVLELFGRAYDRIAPGLPSREVSEFLDAVVESLAKDGKIAGVQVSVFAEMLRDHPWVPETLEELGGEEGVIVEFLDRSFGTRTSVPERQAFKRPAQAILKALLPAPGIDLKGRRRSYTELWHESGFDSADRRFDRLLEILDRELHLITPVESAVDHVGTHAASNAEREYQLTHDHLVPALRDWLTRSSRESWRGRAELIFEARLAQWTRVREGRFLPSAFELVVIAVGVPRRRLKRAGREMVRAAARRHGIRWGAALAVMIGVASTILVFREAGRLREARARSEAVLASAPEAFPQSVEALRSFRDEAAQILAERLTAGIADPAERLQAACALGWIGMGDPRAIAEPLPYVHASPQTCRNVVTALEPRREEAVAELRRAFDGADPLAQVRYALTLLHLGDAEAADGLLRFDENPDKRIVTIRALESWHGDIGAIARLVESHESSALRSGIAIALGRIDPRGLGTVERNEAVHVLARLHERAPEGATHSAAEWALWRWGAELQPLERTSEPAPGRGWFVAPNGLTFVEVPAGTFLMGDPDPEKWDHSRTHEVTITRRYWISTREVSVALYAEHLADVGTSVELVCGSHDPEISPTGRHPVQQVAWGDAVVFANWLSRREGRTPCYAQDGAGRWLCDFTADGYRLPTDAEWERACRAGTTTTYSFGGDALLLEEHAVFSGDRKRETLPCGSLMPNGYGIFDMHGNVWEWVWDWFRPHPASAETDPRGAEDPVVVSGELLAQRTYRGGGISSTRGNPDSTARGHAPPDVCYRNVGFRLVRGE